MMNSPVNYGRIMQKSPRSKTLPFNGVDRPGDALNLAFGGSLTITPPKKLLKKLPKSKACPAEGGMISWTPAGAGALQLTSAPPREKATPAGAGALQLTSAPSKKKVAPKVQRRPLEVIGWTPADAGALQLTSAPSKKKATPKAQRRPLEVVGWKPKGKWLVSLKRGSGTGTFDRMIRGCDSLEDGRKTAEDYFKSGWDEAWIYEKQ